jgi:hypothetical protein
MSSVVVSNFACFDVGRAMRTSKPKYTKINKWLVSFRF